MRIAVAGFQHETNSFVATTASLADFQNPGGWPEFTRGAQILSKLSQTATPLAGALDAALSAQVEVAPLLWCMALPSGPVEDIAFTAIIDEIIERLIQSMKVGPLDGLYLDLHGAMIAQSYPDAEGELLRRLRIIVPEPFPIVCSLDLHANVSSQMNEHATLMDSYRTYPHIDMKLTGARAMRHLIEIIRTGSRPAKAFRQLPFVVPIDSQCTLIEPGAELVARAEAMEADVAGIHCVAQCFGFPLADMSASGPSIVVYADDEAKANQAADALFQLWLDVELAFGRIIPTAKEAVAQALALIATPGDGPVVVADTQDNPGGGGTGDTTGLLAAFIDANADGVVFVHIADEAATAAAHRAGIGANIDIGLGGKIDPQYGAPINGPFKVLALADGNFIGTGPMYYGNRIALGPVALLEKNGVRILVAPRKMQASEPGLLHHVGLSPQDIAILVVKSSVHFRGAYQSIARQIIIAKAPGAVCADLNKLAYTRMKRRVAGTGPISVEHAS